MTHNYFKSSRRCLLARLPPSHPIELKTWSGGCGMQVPIDPLSTKGMKLGKPQAGGAIDSESDSAQVHCLTL